MFFLKTLESTISLNPSSYNANIKKTLINALQKQQIISNYGIILCIKNINSINQQPLNMEGIATFKISYTALILNLMKDEIVELKVIEVNEAGMFLSLSEETTEFLSVFVSNMQMKGEHFGIQRVKIVGSKIENKKIIAIGTVKEECLGPLNE